MEDDRILLSVSDIKRELKDVQKGQIESGLIMLPLCIILIVGLALAFSRTKYLFFAIMIAVIACVIAVCYAFLLVEIIKTAKALKAGRVFVVEDRVVDKKQQFSPGIGEHKRLLYFAQFGKHNIGSGGLHNTFNKKYSVSSFELYSSTQIGDVFYIVTLDKKTVKLIYNTRYFKYQEPNLKELLDDF